MVNSSWVLIIRFKFYFNSFRVYRILQQELSYSGSTKGT